jgi:hypothetical protein
MTQKPIATIMRESLPEGIWMTGLSKTYKDVRYTKTTKTTRWATKHINTMTVAQEKVLLRKLKAALADRDVEVAIWISDILVYQRTPISIVEHA